MAPTGGATEQGHGWTLPVTGVATERPIRGCEGVVQPGENVRPAV